MYQPMTWTLNSIVPSGAGSFFPAGDITTAFGGGSHDDDIRKRLYAGILRQPGFLLFNALRTANFLSTTVMTEVLSRGNEDQPWTQAINVSSGPDAGKDRLYIGINDFNAPRACLGKDEPIRDRAISTSASQLTLG